MGTQHMCGLFFCSKRFSSSSLQAVRWKALLLEGTAAGCSHTIAGAVSQLFEPGSWQPLLRLMPEHQNELQIESSLHACRKLWTGAFSGRRPLCMPSPAWPPS